VDDLYLCLYAKLNGVAIGPMHNPYTLDVLKREGFDLLASIANQPQAPNAAAVSEGDVLAIRI